MVYKVGYIRDVLGNKYLSIKFNKEKFHLFLDELKEHLGDEYDEYVSNQVKRDQRDGHTHHCTVVNVMDMKRLFQEGGSSFVDKLETIQSMDIEDIEFVGIGTATRSGNTAYFVVIDSPTLDEIRKSLGLHPHDFHVTIGFKHKDVFGVRKDKSSLIKKKVN